MQYRRLKRQFNFLIKSIRKYKAQNTWKSLPPNEKSQLLKKLKRLSKRLAGSFTPAYIRKLSLALGLVVIGSHASSQTFLPADSAAFNMQMSTTSPFYRYDPELADLDADGDLDLLVYEGNSLKYYKNIGTPTAPDFAPPLSNPFNFNPSVGHEIGAVDIDNDGDMDIFCGGQYYGTFFFYENVGDSANPNFAAPVSNQFGINPPYDYYTSYSADFVDIDDDGDLDLFTGAEYGSIYFYENIGSISSPNFAAPIQDPFNISWGIMGAIRQKFVDIDKDGDYDMFVGVSAGSTYGFPILYFENIGTKCAPYFANFQVDAFDLQRPTGTFSAGEEIDPAPEFGDMDGDGDMDMFLGYQGVGHFYYFEQDGSGVIPCVDTSACEQIIISSISESNTLELKLFPNPSRGAINVTLKDAATQDMTVEIKNSLGQIIERTTMPEGSVSYKLQLNQPKGIYFLTIQDSVYKVIIE